MFSTEYQLCGKRGFCVHMYFQKSDLFCLMAEENVHLKLFRFKTFENLFKYDLNIVERCIELSLPTIENVFFLN